jgi:hypothetical protein
MPTHYGFGPAQRGLKLGATFHRPARPAGNLIAVESRGLEALYPMLSATNRRLAFAPILKPGAAPAHDTTRVQSKGSSAPTATPADELQKHSAGAHTKAHNSDLS